MPFTNLMIASPLFQRPEALANTAAIPPRNGQAGDGDRESAAYDDDERRVWYIGEALAGLHAVMQKVSPCSATCTGH